MSVFAGPGDCDNCPHPDSCDMCTDFPGFILDSEEDFSFDDFVGVLTNEEDSQVFCFT